MRWSVCLLHRAVVVVVLVLWAGTAWSTRLTPSAGMWMCETNGYRLKANQDGQETSDSEQQYGSIRDSYLYQLSALYSSKAENDSQVCEKLLVKYSMEAEAFISCTIKHAKPVCLCEACHERYWQVVEAYKNISKHADEKCEKKLLESDRIQVLDRMNQFVKTLWTDAFCEACFNGKTGTLSNDTITFYRLLNSSRHCFDDYLESWSHIQHPAQPKGVVNAPSTEWNDTLSPLSGMPKPSKLFGNLSACTSCRDVYVALEVQYNNMRDRATVCMDLQDQMNMTRSTWGEIFDCSDYDLDRSRTLNLTISVLGSAVLAGYYVIFYICGSPKRNQPAMRIVRNSEYS